MLNPKVCNYPLHFADRAGTPLLLHLWNLMSLGQVARAFLAGWNKVLMWNLVFWSCSWSEKRSLKKPRATFRVFYIWYIIEYSNATCKLFNDGFVSTASPRWGFRKSARRSWRALSGQIWETRRAHPRPEVDFSNPRVLNGQKREPLALSQRNEFCLLSQRYVMCRPEVIPPIFWSGGTEGNCRSWNKPPTPMQSCHVWWTKALQNDPY